MNAQKLLAAAAVVFYAGTAFAANAPVAASVAAPVAASVGDSSMDLPTVTVKQPGQSRAEVRAQAVEFVKNFKTALAVQLEQFRN
jgi:hypothetical protein